MKHKKNYKINNVPMYNIKKVLRFNIVEIEKSCCKQIGKNLYDVYFKGHVNCFNNSLKIIIHNNRVIANIRYGNGKAFTIMGYYESFSQLDDIISQTIDDIYT